MRSLRGSFPQDVVIVKNVCDRQKLGLHREPVRTEK